MNYKLEKFWNACIDTGGHHTQKWTINLKSFEIVYIEEIYITNLNEL